MKCLFLDGKEVVSVQEREIATLGANDVLVKLESRGICGTDLNSYRTGVAMGFGHEMGGYVAKAGEKSSFKVGTRVFISNLSPNLVSYAPESGYAYMGGFADYILVKEAKENVDLYPVSEKMSYSQIALIEPFCVGMSGAKKYAFKPESKVVILGAGIIGMCAFEYLKSQGVQKIAVVDINEARLKRVQEAGGIALHSQKENLQEALGTLFGQAYSMMAGMVPDVDVYIDAAGVPVLTKQVVQMMKSFGQLTVLAVYHQPMDMDMATLMYNNIKVSGSCMFSHEDILEAIEILQSHPEIAKRLISHEISLEEAKEGFQIANDASKSLKVMLVG